MSPDFPHGSSPWAEGPQFRPSKALESLKSAESLLTGYTNWDTQDATLTSGRVMPKTKGDMKYLQPWKGYFRVRIRVPQEVQATVAAMLGRSKPVTELVEALGIPESKPCVAERMKHPVVAKFLGQIEEARATLRGEVVRYWHPPWPNQPFTGGIKKYPPPETETAVAPAIETVTFASLIEAKYGMPKTETEKTAKRDATTKLRQFAEWLGFDDMNKVTSKLGNRYVDSLVAEDELSEKSISNHLKTIKSLFKFAFEKDHIDANQMAKVKFNPEGGRKKPPFTPAERKTIFDACLAINGQTAPEGTIGTVSPFMRWFQLLGLFSGMRNSEILRATKESIREIDGVWCFIVQGETKSKQSVRTIPLHSAVIAEGFLDYVAGLPERSKLFPGINGNSSKLLREFFDSLGIDTDVTDEQLEAENRCRKGFYSHRHFVITHFRRRDVNVDNDVKRYLTAHGKGDTHAGYGEYPVADLKHAIETVPLPAL
jgi:integrase